ncbi:MAG: nucleotidyltransferase family protein [Armatimonadota bacterium]|nr:nucleotidyltransferase family protein [Armatimonadota bacterium]
MTRNDILQLLTIHQADLARFDVKTLGVFGSVARGEANPDSDVDVLVEFNGAATFDGYIDLEAFLEDLIGARVDLVTRPSLPSDLRLSIERDVCYVAGLSPVPDGHPARL